MKKVLFIAYYFPPTGGGGVQRVTKFVKYLPSFGWSPVVLTVKNPDFDAFDESLCNDINTGIKVYRTKYLDPVRWYRTYRYGPNSRFEPMGRELFSQTQGPLHRSLFYPIKKLWRLLKYILNNLILVPDDLIFWIPVAVLKGMRVIKEEEIDLIYVTAPPWTSYLVAFFLRYLTKKPYVIDMRDPWILSPYEVESKSVKNKLNRFWERRCFVSANKVINITENITNSYAKYYSDLPPSKFLTITQGFDPDDFVNGKRDESGKFTISHIGTLYNIRTPDNFLIAVKNLINTIPDLRENLQINFVGITGSYINEPMTRYNLQDLVKTIPYLPHRESIQYMKNSSILLLIINKVERVKTQTATGKFYEYLASRRPILGLVPSENDAAGLIVKLKAGRVADPNDVQGIEDAILKMYRDYKNGELNDHIGDISIFNRKELTKRLATILDQTYENMRVPCR